MHTAMRESSSSADLECLCLDLGGLRPRGAAIVSGGSGGGYGGDGGVLVWS